MKFALMALFLMLASQTAWTKSDKSRGSDIKNQIEDTASDVTNQRRVRSAKAAKKREQIKNAVSVLETMSRSEREALKKSIPTLEARVTKAPTDLKLRAQLGKAYLVSGQFEKAVLQLKEASADASIPNLYLLAEAYRGQKDYLDEIRTLEVITQTDEKDAKAFELLGYAYFNTKNFDKSAQNFRKSLGIEPRRRSVYDGLLKLFEAKKSRYESRTVYTDIIKFFGDDEQAYSGLCRLYTEDNLSEDAIKSCQKAISIDASIADNHVYLGMSYNFTKDTGQAQKILVKAAHQFPKSELAQFAAGQLGDELKNWENAKHYYKKCSKVDAGSARCFKRLALVSFQLKDYQESLAAFTVACRLDRTTLTDIRNSTTQLRIQNINPWTSKFQEVSDKCGMN